MAIKPDNDDSHLRELATLFGPLRRQIGQLLYKPSFRNFMTSLIWTTKASKFAAPSHPSLCISTLCQQSEKLSCDFTSSLWLCTVRNGYCARRIDTGYNFALCPGIKWPYMQIYLTCSLRPQFKLKRHYRAIKWQLYIRLNFISSDFISSFYFISITLKEANLNSISLFPRSSTQFPHFFHEGDAGPHVTDALRRPQRHPQHPARLQRRQHRQRGAQGQCTGRSLFGTLAGMGSILETLAKDTKDTGVSKNWSPLAAM